ncbi:MAG: hypothetical protein HN590_17495 [Calditrichaeota bacterium]|jgi:hypothetical protein|nr:hypothetical protein [Calditrichota bacterium]
MGDSRIAPQHSFVGRYHIPPNFAPTVILIGINAEIPFLSFLRTQESRGVEPLNNPFSSEGASLDSGARPERQHNYIRLMVIKTYG